MYILIVDDDKSSGAAVADFVEEQLEHKTCVCHNGNDALRVVQSENIDMVISDMRMPGLSGLDLLHEIKQLPKGENIQVVIMTGFGDLETSIEALRGGAYDYLLKPVNIEELALIIERISELKNKNAESKNENFTKHKKIYNNTTIEIPHVGKIGIFSDAMRNIVRMAEKFHQDREIPVLIEGETGTGKEVISRLVHHGSETDSSNPFVSINCSAISPTLFESELFGYEPGAFTGADKQGKKGKIELAQGGTLFLDEIGELPLEMQPKLLRVLQQKEIFRVGGVSAIPIDVRIVCATNRNLKDMVDEKKFRSDLYYRLNTGRLFIPPLRERPEAILSFAQVFLEKYARKRNRKFQFINAETQKLLTNYEWQGNIRELKNSIERATLLYDDIELKPQHLRFMQTDMQNDCSDQPIELGRIILPEDSLNIEQLEIEIVRKALKKFNNNKTKTAQYLGISRSALRSRMNKL